MTLTRGLISVNISYAFSGASFFVPRNARETPHRQSCKENKTIANPRRFVPRVPPDRTRVNRQIRGNREAKIRVVAEEGQLGILDVSTALRLAEERELDLVEVSPDSDPPVCKIMDYGKFKFEKGKKAREARKKQATVTLKEIKMRPMISTHDYDFKMRNVEKFLDQGDKVKITIRFRGREMARQELGMRVLERVSSDLTDRAKVESSPRMEGRQMVMVLAPNKA